jgi:stage V sporulation protein R
MELLYQYDDWNFDDIARMLEVIEQIGVNELKMDIYPNQIEIITSEQMLDVYSSVGLPVMYRHWSFGKHFARDDALYKKGIQGLAYEVVINSNPCISYLMEENTSTMQALVLAHAAIGHNTFFKTNNLFRQWTDADGIIDYMSFAQRYIQECEDKYGLHAVERILDAAHALRGQSVDRYKRRIKRLGEEKTRAEERRAYAESTWNPLWSTLPDSKEKLTPNERDQAAAKIREQLNLPEENLLYFLEKNAPKLKGWEREILRIVRKSHQYLYPQGQTKLMNEGAATVTHYEIINRLHERGGINDGNFLEFLASHTSVITQRGYQQQQQWNPYALGFAMMQDIRRIATNPTDEDREWFPHIAGYGDEWGLLKSIWADYRDESFVLQFLSPKLMRDFGMFRIHDEGETSSHLKVTNIHNERGYRQIRQKLAESYQISQGQPDINISSVDLMGDRTLILTNAIRNGVTLHRGDGDMAQKTLNYLADLWGYKVEMRQVDSDSGKFYDKDKLEAFPPKN